jgi:hypothetical protein
VSKPRHGPLTSAPPPATTPKTGTTPKRTPEEDQILASMRRLYGDEETAKHEELILAQARSIGEL